MVDDSTIILSDIHLTSSLCQSKLLNEFLKTIQVKRLIINGDLFDDINLKRLNKEEWKVLGNIRKLSKRLELIFCVGNHDIEAENLSPLLGVEVVDSYMFESGGKKIICIHGDKFDRYVVENPWLTYFADLLYKILQRFSKKWARKLKLQSKTFLRCIEEIKTKAIEYKNKLGYDYVICSHTHVPYEGYDYFNTGSFVNLPCTYIEVIEGVVKLKEV